MQQLRTYSNILYILLWFILFIYWSNIYNRTYYTPYTHKIKPLVIRLCNFINICVIRLSYLLCKILMCIITWSTNHLVNIYYKWLWAQTYYLRNQEQFLQSDFINRRCNRWYAYRKRSTNSTLDRSDWATQAYYRPQDQKPTRPRVEIYKTA